MYLNEVIWYVGKRVRVEEGSFVFWNRMELIKGFISFVKSDVFRIL